MSVLVWGSPCDKVQKVLQRLVGALPCEGGLCEEVLVLGSLDDLKAQILARRPDVEVLALAPGSAEDLNRLLEMACLLRDQRLVLLLPDARPETVSAGNRLRPRYSALVSSEPEEVASVVRRVFCHKRQGFSCLWRPRTPAGGTGGKSADAAG